jgi:hypothetical protein
MAAGALVKPTGEQSSTPGRGIHMDGDHDTQSAKCVTLYRGYVDRRGESHMAHVSLDGGQV